MTGPASGSAPDAAGAGTDDAPEPPAEPAAGFTAAGETTEETAEESAAERPKIPGTNQPIPQTLEEAFGGKKGMLDTGLPGIVFVLAFMISGHDMTIAIWSAIGVAAVLTVVRIVSKDPVQNAIAGFVGVAIAAFVAAKTGEPANYYLTSLLLTVAYGLAFGISLLVRWPLLGAGLGFVFGEGTAWRKDPARRRGYTLATFLWFLMFVVRLAILVPFWLEGWLVALGIGRLILGYPLYALVIWLSWRIIHQTKPVRPEPKESTASE